MSKRTVVTTAYTLNIISICATILCHYYQQCLQCKHTISRVTIINNVCNANIPYQDCPYKPWSSKWIRPHNWKLSQHDGVANLHWGTMLSPLQMEPGFLTGQGAPLISWMHGEQQTSDEDPFCFAKVNRTTKLQPAFVEQTFYLPWKILLPAWCCKFNV